jgi:hypothetical protein
VEHDHLLRLSACRDPNIELLWAAIPAAADPKGELARLAAEVFAFGDEVSCLSTEVASSLKRVCSRDRHPLISDRPSTVHSSIYNDGDRGAPQAAAAPELLVAKLAALEAAHASRMQIVHAASTSATAVLARQGQSAVFVSGTTPSTMKVEAKVRGSAAGNFRSSSCDDDVSGSPAAAAAPVSLVAKLAALEAAHASRMDAVYAASVSAAAVLAREGQWYPNALYRSSS